MFQTNIHVVVHIITPLKLSRKKKSVFKNKLNLKIFLKICMTITPP